MIQRPSKYHYLSVCLTRLLPDSVPRFSCLTEVCLVTTLPLYLFFTMVSTIQRFEHFVLGWISLLLLKSLRQDTLDLHWSIATSHLYEINAYYCYLLTCLTALFLMDFKSSRKSWTIINCNVCITYYLENFSHGWYCETCNITKPTGQTTIF